jgi:hypothetical protein
MSVDLSKSMAENVKALGVYEGPKDLTSVIQDIYRVATTLLQGSGGDYCACQMFVPHFVLFEAPGAWFRVFTMWLDGRGLRIKPLARDAVDRECLAIGMSPRGVEHVVVWGPDGLVHDPHPSRDGIEARQFWAIEPPIPTDGSE